MRFRKTLLSLAVVVVGLAGLTTTRLALAEDGQSRGTSRCVATGWGKACFNHDGDRLSAYDRAADGMHVRAFVKYANGSGFRVCKNTRGADSVKRCDFDLRENARLKVWVALYNGSDHKRSSRWVPARA